MALPTTRHLLNPSLDLIYNLSNKQSLPFWHSSLVSNAACIIVPIHRSQYSQLAYHRNSNTLPPTTFRAHTNTAVVDWQDPTVPRCFPVFL